MKLKTYLMATFIAVTIVPILVITVLLYFSGINLSKTLYQNNTAESVNIQANYIEQFIRQSMISNYKFTQQYRLSKFLGVESGESNDSNLYETFRIFLNMAEDQAKASMLMDLTCQPIYSTGESGVVRQIVTQAAQAVDGVEQVLTEFALESGRYTLGVITPVLNENGELSGYFVVAYEESYLFKIISSYYNLSESSIFICRANGEIIDYKADQTDGERDAAYLEALKSIQYEEEGAIDSVNYFGYYRQIENTPWYLACFVSTSSTYQFLGKLALIDGAIIAIVVLFTVMLSIYNSRKVVRPINRLIQVIEQYERSLDMKELGDCNEYLEINYLYREFNSLMRNIISTQKNLTKVYQLYHSITDSIGDIVINLDIAENQATSNDSEIQALLDQRKDCAMADKIKHLCGYFEPEQGADLYRLLNDMAASGTVAATELDVLCKLKDNRWHRLLAIPMYEMENLVTIFIQMRDIHFKKVLTIESLEKSQKDILTGLYNRAEFIARANCVLKNSGPQDMHAVLFIDMNRFKSVNDNFGHRKGDELLLAVAELMEDTVEQQDVCARFGGDEFAVLLPHTDEAAALAKAKKLREVLCFSYQKENIRISVSASVGVSIWHSGSAQSVEQLLELADVRMYEEKKQSRKKWDM